MAWGGKNSHDTRSRRYYHRGSSGLALSYTRRRAGFNFVRFYQHFFPNKKYQNKTPFWSFLIFSLLAIQKFIQNIEKRLGGRVAYLEWGPNPNFLMDLCFWAPMATPCKPSKSFDKISHLTPLPALSDDRRTPISCDPDNGENVHKY